jgi:hypothetical protein
MWNPLRRFFNSQDPPQDSRPDDSYFQKLLRYIPADIVAAYLTIDGIVRAQSHYPDWLPWTVFGVMFLMTPFYVVFKMSDPPGFTFSRNFNIAASLFAFTVWALALDGAFAHTVPGWSPVYGSILLVLTTLLMPIAEKLFLKFVPNPNPGNVPAAPPSTPPATPPASGPKPGSDTNPDKK